MNSAIEVRGLTKKFGQLTAVNSIDMSIPENVVYGFLGPNGSGKTTAIRMMCGLLTPTMGSIEVLGLRIPENTEKIRRQVGYMTQRFSMYGDLTVEQNLLFVGSIMGIRGQLLKERVGEQLDRFRLLSFGKTYAGLLSGGQKRRLAIAAATIHRPKLLLLDEPTSEVDPNTRREFWGQLFEMADGGTTILVTTHLMDEAERCHHLAIIDKGVKVADGSPAQLRKDLGASIVEVTGGSLTELKGLLQATPPVLATTQIGMTLRVMIADSIEQPEKWLAEMFSMVETYTTRVTEPTIEDVFVRATSNTEGAGR